MMARVPGMVHQQFGESVFLRCGAEDAHRFDAKSEKRVNGVRGRTTVAADGRLPRGAAELCRAAGNRVDS